MNIALIGFRGTGKTTVARLLARKFDKKLISTDEEIVKKANMSPPKFVEKYGWDKFLELESEMVESISYLDECVFDTSDGIVVRNENIINLKKNALIVLLTADIKTIISRVRRTAKNNDAEELKNDLLERESKYKRAADYAIDTSRLSPEEVCDLITHYIQMELK